MTAEHPAADAVEHLRQAALELVKAAHLGLDLVEEVVADPRGLSGLAGVLADAARVLLSQAPDGCRGWAGGGGPGARRGRAGGADPAGWDDRPGGGDPEADGGHPEGEGGGPDGGRGPDGDDGPVDPGVGPRRAASAPADPGGRHRPGVQRIPLS